MNQNQSSVTGASTALREFKHTPGKWELDGITARETAPYAWTRYVFTPETGTTHIAAGPDAPTCDANARLIAAAPDLLEACIAALPQVQRFHCTDPNGETCGNPVIELLQSAIAKATHE